MAAHTRDTAGNALSLVAHTQTYTPLCWLPPLLLQLAHPWPCCLSAAAGLLLPCLACLAARKREACLRAGCPPLLYPASPSRLPCCHPPCAHSGGCGGLPCLCPCLCLCWLLVVLEAACSLLPFRWQHRAALELLLPRPASSSRCWTTRISIWGVQGWQECSAVCV